MTRLSTNPAKIQWQSKKKTLLNPVYLLHAKNLTISWWNSYLPDNFFTKFKFWVCHFVVVLSILCLFGFPEQIFIEMKGGKNMSEEIIEAKHCQTGCQKVLTEKLVFNFKYNLPSILRINKHNTCKMSLTRRSRPSLGGSG